MRKTTKFFQSKEQEWVIFDAKDRILGRLATRIAKVLIGKNKATYTPNAVSGDRVIVINARHVKLSADKYNKKTYDKYTGYTNGRKEISLPQLMQKNPTKVLQSAVKGMLPKNSLGKEMLKGLKIYPDQEHNQQAQKPKMIGA